MPEQPVTEPPAAAGLYVSTAWRQDGELPPLLRGKARARDQAVDPLLSGLRVEGRYLFPADARGASMDAGEIVRFGEGTVLALETEDGATIIIHAGRLAEVVGRLQPQAVRDGAVDLTLFREPDGGRPVAAPWKAVTVLRLPQDGLADEAAALAAAWAAEARQATAASLVAKALPWCIESRLVERSGLYRWQERTIAAADRCPPGDVRLDKARAGAPLLLLIHGLGSNTVGSFVDLRADDDTWQALQARFPGGIFGYEHRTFSQSPQENALELLDALPDGARVSLLSHGRGGLVADLLCLGTVAEEAFSGDGLSPEGADNPDGADAGREDLCRIAYQIASRIGERRLVVEQHVRVACPARGSRLLSDNLEVALSGFLNVSQWRGGAALDIAGAAAGASTGGASSAAGTLKRLLLEIAGRRIASSLIPGLAALDVDSPLVAFLAHPGTGCRPGIRMAVIAGTASGAGKPGRRAIDLFCGWRPLDDDGDLVVDTEAMYGGLASRAGASYFHEQSESLNHFRYFARASIRDAVCDWLRQNPVASAPVPPFQWLDDGAPVASPVPGRGGVALPVLILLPDSMGSCLAVNRDVASPERIWFDFARLADGQLARLADISDATIGVDGLWERFYGGLADYLAASHTLVRFPYDWRQPLETAADALAEVVAAAVAASPGQPIRFLAHGAGGLVVRALMSRHPASWRAVVDSGGRLLLLGTPNNGEHRLVHGLLGKGAAIRGLERRDARHDLRQLLAIVAGFPGVLSLLPRPSAAEAGGGYFLEALWRELGRANTDRWYGDGLAAAFDAARLADAASFWQKTLPGNTVPDPERVSQIFGQGAQTPCGVARTVGGRLQLLFTGEGDGAVTWASGRLDNVVESENVWYMPAEHADLVADARYFPALFEVLDSGRTRLLGRLPRRRGDSAPLAVVDLPPPVFPGEDELARALFGSRPRRRAPSRKAALSVAVRAGDLRFIDQPLLCGHFIGDPIAAAEAELDAQLDGRLSERERLGVYAGPIGTSVIVLPPPSDGQNARGSRPGAIIVGLGDFNGQLGVRQISETVRAAVLRLLLRLRDNGARAPQTVHLYSLLLGCNSTAHIGVTDSVAAVTCGVLEANRQFAQALAKATGRGIAVESLTFLEIFRDVAISAAHAVAGLPQALAGPLRRLEAQLDVAPVLTIGDGVRERLSVGQGLGYWSRLIVTDAETDTGDRPSAGETPGRRPAGRRAAAGGTGGDLPEALKYVFLSQRARAETLLQQRQPGLIESIVQRQRLVTADNPQLARMLFQLMVPVDYKVVLRERTRLLLILDSYTASLPWELLQADDEPLAVKTPMIRQLITSRFRGNVPTAGSNAACLIVSPSTEGFDKRFGGAASRLDKLPAAVAEGEGIREALREAGWTDIAYCREETDAIEVLGQLYRQPYRLLTICGHGLFAARALDGRDYTGVVLSDGMLIGAVEIGLMEVVPEVVFLSCCHLGSMTRDSQPARLAYSLARELIDSGVRCVLAAGWAVEDKAAKTFATTFFAQLIAGDTYGEAVFAARRSTYDRHRGSNTWGAYQAYGDPGYRLGPDYRPGGKKEDVYVAVEELLDRLESRCVRSARTGIDRRPDFAAETAWVAAELARCPAEWRGRPEVQQAIGTLYAGLGSDGFDAARSALRAALQTEDADGRVACRTIEQLAKIEARQGDQLIERGLHAQGLALIDSAVARLQALEQASGAGALPVNPERAALSASALKRKALVLAGNADTPWTTVAQALALAAAAYFKAGNGGDPREPYHTLNALPLAWLAGTHDFAGQDAGEVARQCGEEARRRFADSQDFWDAACGTDALVVDWLLGDTVDDVDHRLARAYRQLASEVPHTDSEWQAVRRQLQLLATFLRRRGRCRDAERAAVLEQLAELPPEAGKDSGDVFLAGGQPPYRSSNSRIARNTAAERKTLL